MLVRIPTSVELTVRRFFSLMSIVVLWFGLHCCSSDTPIKTAYRIYNSGNAPFPNDHLNQIEIDSKSNKWIGLNGGGLWRFDGTHWTSYTTCNTPLPNDTVSSIFIDQSDIVYVVTRKGIVINDHDFWSIIDSSNSPVYDGLTSSVAVDAENNIWVTSGNWSSPGGLFKRGPSGWTVYDTSNSPIVLHAIPHKVVVDANNVKWVATVSGGIFRLEGTEWSSFYTGNSSVPFDEIDNLYLHSDNSLWLLMRALFSDACDAGAVSKFENGQFANYFPALNGQATNKITSFLISGKSVMWFATSVSFDGCDGRDYALSSFDGANWKVYGPTQQNFPRAYIPDMAVDKDSLWMASDQGLIVMSALK